MLVPLTSTGIIIAAASPTPVPDFFSSQLFGIIIGGTISAAVSFVGSWIIYNQQKQRDKDAYIRSIKDAKRERLRAAYKLILDAALQYKSVLSEIGVVWEGETEKTRNERLSSSLREKLKGVDEAMVEITLEDVGADVETIFNELRQAFIQHRNTSTSVKQFPGAFSPLEVDEGLRGNEHLVDSKVEELKTVMKKHLKELER